MHGQTCSKTRIIAKTAKKARCYTEYTNKAPDMHWEFSTVSSMSTWSVTSRTLG